MDCFTKIVTPRGLDGKEVTFRRERNVILNCIIRT